MSGKERRRPAGAARFGNCFVVVGLVVRIGPLGERAWCLPVLFRLWPPTPKPSRRDPRPERRPSQPDLAALLVAEVAERHPQRRIDVVGDAAFACRPPAASSSRTSSCACWLRRSASIPCRSSCRAASSASVRGCVKRAGAPRCETTRAHRRGERCARLRGRVAVMALLSFDQFEAAVPELLAEAPGARGDLHPVGRFGEEGPLKPLGAAIAAAARLVPHIDRPLEPGAHYISPDGEPPRRWDVRAEALAVLAQILEASAAIRSTMSAESARLRGDAGAGAIAEEAFLSFAAPGGGLPVEILEWSLAVEQLGGALAFLQNSRVGPEIGPAGAHDALDRAAAHVVCVLARSTRSARRRRGEQRGALVKLAACGPGDLVLVCKGGRRSYAKMHEISDGLVCVEAIQRGVTWRHATAHEIIDHWRHARRRHSGEASVAVEGPPPLPPPAQLSFAGRLERPGAEGG